MNIDLIKITEEEIKISAENSVKNEGAGIMYLHNYGNKEQVMQFEDIRPWVDEDLDD